MHLSGPATDDWVYQRCPGLAGYCWPFPMSQPYLWICKVIPSVSRNVPSHLLLGPDPAKWGGWCEPISQALPRSSHTPGLSWLPLSSVFLSTFVPAFPILIFLFLLPKIQGSHIALPFSGVWKVNCSFAFFFLERMEEKNQNPHTQGTLFWSRVMRKLEKHWGNPLPCSHMARRVGIIWRKVMLGCFSLLSSYQFNSYSMYWVSSISQVLCRGLGFSGKSANTVLPLRCLWSLPGTFLLRSHSASISSNPSTF